MHGWVLIQSDHARSMCLNKMMSSSSLIMCYNAQRWSVLARSMRRAELTCRATAATDVNQLAGWLLWGFWLHQLVCAP